MKRLIAIGDVHGCLYELNKLIDHLAPTEDDTFVFIGDLIDRGPNSIGVIDLVASMDDHYDTYWILGNHDRKCKKWYEHMSSGRQEFADNYRDADEYAAITTSLTSDGLHALLHATLPYYQEGCYLFVHAGVDAHVRPPLPSALAISEMSNKERRPYDAMMFVRAVGQGGHMVPLSMIEPRHRSWVDIYDGRFGRVVYGHQAFMVNEPIIKNETYGIDLGCVFGGLLCALVIKDPLDPGNKPTWLTVKAASQYCENALLTEE